VTFEEHLQNHQNDDGSYDLEAAERARADEIARTPGEIAALAAKAAKHERTAWENKETANLRKQFMQPALSSELELEVMVPLGDSVVVRYGDMDHKRIRLRKDLRTKIHLDEARAFDAELTHWMRTEQLLDDGQTITDALAAGAS
jgi:hypothetical protein